MPQTFLSADHHFDHKELLSFYKQPFKTIEERNLKIVNNHNERVKKDDDVYVVGDFCFYKSNYLYWKNQLNGNLIFLKGNHDKKTNGSNFKLVRGVLSAGGMHINVVHDPIYANPKYPLNLVGHVHDKFRIISFKQFYKDRLADLKKDLPISYLNKVKIFVEKWKGKERKSTLFNVGLDVNGYYPLTLEEVISQYYSWKKRNEN